MGNRTTLSGLRLVLPAFVFWSSILAVAAEFSVRVVGASDGDTITVLPNGKAGENQAARD